MSTGKVVLGTLAGFAVGAIAGILFAPEKGSITRKQIYDKGAGFANKMKSKVEEFSETFMEEFETKKQETGSMVAKGKSKYEDAKKDGRNEAANVATEIKHATL